MAKSNAKVAPKTTIMDDWNLSEADLKAGKMERNLRMLKTKGNEHIINLQGKHDDACEAYDAAIMAAKKTPNFAAIATADIAKQASNLELEKATETYITIFGEKPSIA